jgi:PBP1b-binding outer membrane lipoprotein LpoB
MYRISYSILLTLLLSGCAAVDDSKKTITYDKAAWKYETAIRWVDFGTANTLRRLEDSAAYSPDLNTLQHIKVTSYNVINSTVSEDHTEIRLAVEIIYYNDDRMKLSTIIDNQVWKYDPEIRDWYITTPLPPFK